MGIEIVMTQGKFTLLPIAGEEVEGKPTRVGYYFNFTDPESGITLVAPLPVEQARQLGEALMKDVEELGVEGGTSIEIAKPEVLKRLSDHRARGGGRR